MHPFILGKRECVVERVTGTTGGLRMERKTAFHTDASL
jgi:hypothetical protein